MAFRPDFFIIKILGDYNTDVHFKHKIGTVVQRSRQKERGHVEVAVYELSYPVNGRTPVEPVRGTLDDLRCGVGMFCEDMKVMTSHASAIAPRPAAPMMNDTRRGLQIERTGDMSSSPAHGRGQRLARSRCHGEQTAR